MPNVQLLLIMEIEFKERALLGELDNNDVKESYFFFLDVHLLGALRKFEKKYQTEMRKRQFVLFYSLLMIYNLFDRVRVDGLDADLF